METSPKESSRGGEKPASLAPPNPIDPVLSDWQLGTDDDELQRYRGAHAPLASIAGQLRRAKEKGDAKQVAAISARLARQFARRGVELREAIKLAERSLELQPDPGLSIELANIWVTVGDYARGAGALVSLVGEFPLDKRSDIQARAGLIHAHAGRMAPALRALHHSSESDPDNPEPLEALGAMGFWANFPKTDASQAFLQAARARSKMGNDSRAFENLLSAFEVDPVSPDAAEALIDALEQRGRSGAADEILREHLRQGLASRRAAHHERDFYRALELRQFERALASALEAELDVDLGSDQLESALEAKQREEASRPADFEAFLLHLASSKALGDGSIYMSWLISLVELHTFDWGATRVAELRSRLERLCGPRNSARQSEASDSVPVVREFLASDPHALRRELAQQQYPDQQLRLHIGYAEAARGNWPDAAEALELALASERLPQGQLGGVGAVSLALLVAGRSRAGGLRAEAMRHLSPLLPAEAAAVGFALAAEALSEHERVQAAADCAASAVAADPRSKRAVAAQALVALRHPEVASSSLVESSLAVLVARGQACRLLCEAATARGAHRMALTWAARRGVLRPGDPSAAVDYLQCAARAKDPERLRDAIVEVLRRPLPYVEIAEPIAEALDELREQSLESATQAAHTLLEMMGTRFEAIRSALGRLIEQTKDQTLRAEILERRIALAPAGSRPDLLMELADARRSEGDATNASRALRRAMAQGADPQVVRDELRRLGVDLEPDATISQLEARVSLLEKLDSDNLSKRADLLRRLGAARWDMAEDPEGAVSAWLRAADLDPQHGLERFAHVMRTVAGVERAARELEHAASQTDDPARQAKLLGLSGRAHLDLGESKAAFALAQAALARAPEVAELLALAERAASKEQAEELEIIYRDVAQATLGTYGQRAVHYRAARFFESRRDLPRALPHAIAAFEAVPAEGVAFVLMLRLADRTDDRDAVVAAVERVAASQDSDEARGRWLEKAAALAEPSTSGLKQRLEILLRAAQVRPEVETLETLDSALVELLEAEPEAKQALHERLGQVIRDALAYASGAHGALVAIRLAKIAILRFDDAKACLRCMEKATECDIELPEYRDLIEVAQQLAKHEEQARHIIKLAKESSELEGNPLGRGLAEFAGQLAHQLGDDATRAELIVRAASDAPEDLELASLAGQLAQEVERPDLLEIVEDLLPIAERAQALRERLPEMGPEEAVEALLALGIDAADEPLRSELLTELGRRQEDLGLFRDASITWRELAEVAPENLEALAGLERFAQRHSDHEELARVLRVREELLGTEDDKRRLRMRRAVVLETKLGRPVESRSLLQEVLDQGEDWTVLRLLADSWERSQDHHQAAKLWQRAKELAPGPDDRDDACYRAARALLALGDTEAALAELQQIERPDGQALELRLQAARDAKDRKLELEVLVRLAEATSDSSLAAERFYAAARLGLELGEIEAAGRYAEKASSQGAGAAAARLLSAQLRLRARPLATRKQAHELLEQLAGTEELGGASQRELRSFLVAEARALIDGLGASVKYLEQALVDQGERPLLCAALAEKIEDPARALQLYDQAIGGELQGMRREGDLLLQASAVARQQGLLERAQAFASAVADDDPRRPDAARELESLAVERTKRQRMEREARLAVQEQKAAHEKNAEQERAARHEAEEQERMEREAAEQAAARQAEQEQAEKEAQREREAAEQAARAAGEQAEREAAEQAARAAREQREREAAEQAARAAREQEATDQAARADRAQSEREQRQSERAQAQRRKEDEERSARESAEWDASAEDSDPHAAPNLSEPKAGPGSDRLPGPPAAEPSSSHRHHLPSAPPPEAHPNAQKRRRRRLSSHRLSIHPGDLKEVDELSEEEEQRAIHLAAEREEALVDKLEQGEFDAGLELLDVLSEDRTRTRDAVVVAGHLARMKLSEASALGRLINLASRDGNEPLALSVRHVLGCFGAGDPVLAPPMENLEEQPDAARSVLWRGVRSAGFEAVGLVWEHASALFKREPADYQVSGVQRVPLTAPTPLGELYRGAARAMGMTRTPLFRQPSDGGNIRMNVALLTPPAIIVEGDVPRASTELSFHFGAMLAAAAPEHALLFGLPPEDLDILLAAMSMAFGAPTRGPGAEHAVAQLAGRLWETIPPRVQRRLSTLCAEPEELTVDSLLGHSRLVLRRAGLVVCGDLGMAVKDACQELGMQPPRTLSALEKAAQQSVAVADLVDLALTPEYAELRFHEVRHSTSLPPLK